VFESAFLQRRVCELSVPERKCLPVSVEGRLDSGPRLGGRSARFLPCRRMISLECEGVPLANSPRLDLHDTRGSRIAELAGWYQRSGVSLNSFVAGGVGTSKTLSVTEMNE
jgi:hypothetical protein